MAFSFIAMLYFAYRAYQKNELKNYWVLLFPLMVFVGLILTREGQELIAILLANFFFIGIWDFTTSERAFKNANFH